MPESFCSSVPPVQLPSDFSPVQLPAPIVTRSQIGQGGLLLWVQVKRLGQVATAIQALNGHRALHVHVHLLERGREIEPGRPECIQRTVGA
jgi:hypothetical protein